MSWTTSPRASCRRSVSLLIAGLCMLFVGSAGAALAQPWSIEVQEVRGQTGVTAWLVESHAQPVVAVRFSFDGGSMREPQDKRGIASVLAEALGEGEGAGGSDELRRRLAGLSATVAFSAGRDSISGSLDAPSSNIEVAARLVGAQVSSMRFGSDAVARASGRSIAALSDMSGNPAVRAEDEWYAAAFAGHPYAMSPAGSAASLASITPADLVHFKSRVMTRDRLTVAVAGDIDAARLRRVLDLLFGALPVSGPHDALPAVRVIAPAEFEAILPDVPTAGVVFGLEVPRRRDPGYMPALVLNEIVGGGATSSRLGQALRFRSSLVYDVDSRLISDAHASYLIGQFSTSSTDAQRAISALKNEFERVVTEGVTEAEVEDAKGYLNGSFPLSFDSSPKIASNLLAIAQAGLGRDYPEIRRRAIERVSRDDVNRVASELLRPERLIIAVARGAY